MNHRVLTQEQIDEAKSLKEKGYTNRQLARYFEVGKTTIWENILHPERSRAVLRSLGLAKVYTYSKRPKKVCHPCRTCEICLTRQLDDTKAIPQNFRVGDQCMVCYLRERGVNYLEIIARRI